ncbi:MAG: hypothetical protein ACRDYD_05255 [Acidimicrobiales bacterium]
MADLSKVLDDLYCQGDQGPRQAAGGDPIATEGDASGADVPDGEQEPTTAGATDLPLREPIQGIEAGEKPDGGSVPPWASPLRLDMAFADWTPGPPADAPEAERALLDEAGGELATAGPTGSGEEPELLGPPGPLGPPDCSELAAGVTPPATDPAYEAPAAAGELWSRSDDDILPRRRRLELRRAGGSSRPAAPARPRLGRRLGRRLDSPARSAS